MVVLRWLAAVLVAASVAVAPVTAVTAAPSGPVEVGPVPIGPVEKRVIDLVATATSRTSSLPQARQAVTDLLSGAGIKPVASPAEAPAAPRAVMYALTVGVDALVADARSRSTSSRQTLAGYAAQLREGGRRLSSDAVEHMPAFLAEWLGIARSQPGLPGSNAIFALSALAARQRPAVDLARPDYNAADLRLTFLDLDLLYAGMARTAAAAFDLKAAEPAPKERARVRLDPPPPAAPGPCDAVVQDLGRLVPPLAGPLEGLIKGAVPKAVQPAVKLIAQAYVKHLAEDPARVAEMAADILKQANVIAKILQLAETYRLSHASAEVLSANPIHRPLPGESLNTAVKVTFGVPEDQWASAGHGTRPSTWSNCLKMAKMPYATNATDVAAELTQWQAEWKITGPDAIHWKGDGVGTAGLLFTDRLVAETDHTASVARQFQVMEEAEADHPGELVTEDVTITAKLYRPAAPDFGTVVTTVTTGGIGAIFNYTLKSFSMLFPKRVSVVVRVTRHVPKPSQWSGTVQFTYAATDVSRPVDEWPPPDTRDEITVTEKNYTSVVRVTGVLSIEGDTWKSIALRTAITSNASYTRQQSYFFFSPATSSKSGEDCVAMHRSTGVTSMAGSTTDTTERVSIFLDEVKNSYELQAPLVSSALSGRASNHDVYDYRNPAGNCVRLGYGKSHDDRSWSTEETSSLSVGSFFKVSRSITPGQKVLAGQQSTEEPGGRLTMVWSLTRS